MVVVLLLPVPAMVPPVARMVTLARCGAAASLLASAWAWIWAVASSSAHSAVIHRAGVVCSMGAPVFALRDAMVSNPGPGGRVWRKNHRARCYHLGCGAMSRATP